MKALITTTAGTAPHDLAAYRLHCWLSVLTVRGRRLASCPQGVGDPGLLQKACVQSCGV